LVTRPQKATLNSAHLPSELPVNLESQKQPAVAGADSICPEDFGEDIAVGGVLNAVGTPSKIYI